MTYAFGKKGTGPRILKRHGGRDWEVAGLDVVSPIFPVKAEAEKWMRKMMEGLPAARQIKRRACLCCGTVFASEGAHNRMCNRCRQAGSDAMGLAASISGTRLRRVTH